jgi:hypothetical protein
MPGRCALPDPLRLPTLSFAEPDALSDAKSESDRDCEPDSDGEYDPDMDAQSESDPDCEPDTDIDTESQPDTNGEYDAVADCEPDAVADAKSQPDADRQPIAKLSLQSFGCVFAVLNPEWITSFYKIFGISSHRTTADPTTSSPKETLLGGSDCWPRVATMSKTRITTLN